MWNDALKPKWNTKLREIKMDPKVAKKFHELGRKVIQSAKHKNHDNKEEKPE